MKKAILSLIIASTLLLSACNSMSGTMSTTTTTTATETTESPIPKFTQTPTETTLESYDFVWDNEKGKAFDKYCKNRFGIGLSHYVCFLGYTEELQDALTEFINTSLNKNYDKVPYSKVNYFYSQVNISSTRYTFRDLRKFKIRFFDEDNDFFHTSTLNNKLLLSYLVSNKIPYGMMISMENMKLLVGNDVYKLNIDEMNEVRAANFGNNPSIKYDGKLLVGDIQAYQYSLQDIFDSERIKTRNFADAPESVEIFNKHLRDILGENAPQIGEVFTPERYRALFGEDPWDLSNIPGAIYAK